MTDTPKDKAGGWLSHDGGPMPVDGKKFVYVCFGDRETDGPFMAEYWVSDDNDRDYWISDPIDPLNDIIAYRIVGTDHD